MNFAGSREATAALLLTWTAKATLLLGLASVAAFVLRKHSAALRHRVWAIAIASSLALPLVSLAVPAWHVISRPVVATEAVSPSTLDVDSTPVPAPAAQAERGLDAEKWIAPGLSIWALGTLLVLLGLGLGLVRLWRISAYSTMASEDACAALDQLRARFGIKRRVRLLVSASATTMPMTWGAFRPRVVLPSGASKWVRDRQCIVFSHELAHVLRNDWLLQFCAELLRACFWFHPLAWIAARRLRQESERASDDAVLNSGITASEYAGQLLALAQTLKTPSRRFSLALAVARPSNLESRFAALLNSSLSRKPLSLKGNWIAISLGACLLLPLAALSLSAATPSESLQPSALAELEVSTANAPAAAGDGSISGMITDQRRAGILGATVTLVSGSAHTVQKAETGSDGKFLFSNLPPGMYVVNIERRGFRSEPRHILVSLHDQVKMASVLLALDDPRVPASTSSAHPGEAPAVRNAPTQATQSGPVSSISGSVGDPSGAMIPRANVTLTDVATGQQQQIATGPAGEFSFSNLIPDGYELSVTQVGFQVYRQTIQLYPGEELQLPELLLRIGEVFQEVTISASRTGPVTPPMPAVLSTGPPLACPAQTTQAVEPTFKDPVQAGPPPRRIRVGGMVEAASLLHQSLPIYSQTARAAGITGTVVLKGIVGKDGTLLSTCVLTGPTLLAQSAFDAVSQWRYSPALLNGEPVEVVTQIAVVYMLTN